MGKGVLHVTVEGCKGLKDELIGNQDPYAIVVCGAAKHKTPTAKGGGKNPVWNSKAEFNVDAEDSIEVTIYDDDTLKDDFLGSAKLSLSGVLSKGSVKEEVPIKTKSGKDNGFVILSLSFAGAAGFAAKSEGGSHGIEKKSESHGSDKKESHGDEKHGKSEKHEKSEKHDGDKPKKEKKEKKDKKEKKKKDDGGSSSSSSDSD